MKKSAFNYFLILLCFITLFVSCDGASGGGGSGDSSQPSVDYHFDKWNEGDDLYSVYYHDGVFSSDYSNVVFIEKTKGTPFVILNITDVQIESNLNESNSQIVFFKKTMQHLINQYKPNLITYTGDFGDYGSSKSSLVYISNIIDSFGIPWAPVFGNHDNESSLNAVKSVLLEEDYQHCLFKTGPDNLAKIENLTGKTNNPALGHYVVNIVEKDADAPKGYNLVNSLIFMNTGNYKSYSSSEISSKHQGESKYGTGLFDNWSSLNDKQLAWYEWAVNSAEAVESGVKSSLFIHIPIFAYARAINEAVVGTRNLYSTGDLYAVTKDISFAESKNASNWNEGYKTSEGVMHGTKVGCGNYDDFVFDKIKDLGSTNFVICGHDHINNFSINYQGVQLVYGTKLGPGCYWESGLSGGTVITITDSTKVEQVVYMPEN